MRPDELLTFYSGICMHAGVVLVKVIVHLCVEEICIAELILAVYTYRFAHKIFRQAGMSDVSNIDRQNKA